MAKIKKPTVRFYTSSDSYQGFRYLSEVTYFEMLNWIKSGNYLKHNDSIIDSRSSSSQLFNLLRKWKL